MEKLPHSLGTAIALDKSLYYRGLSSPESVVSEIPGKYAGVEAFPTTYFTFKNPTAQTFEKLMDYTDITPCPAVDKEGNQIDVYKTVNKVFSAPAVDRSLGSNYNPEFLFNPEDPNSDRMARWLAGSHMLEYVPTPRFTKITVGHYERPSTSEPELQKFVTDIAEYDGPMNKLGMFLSKTAALKNDWKDYLVSIEGLELALERAMDFEDVAYLGVNPAEGVIYSIQRLRGGGIKLSAGINSGDYLDLTSEVIGVPLTGTRNAILGEEAMHLYRKSFDKKIFTLTQLIKEEHATKMDLLHHYEGLAKKAEGNESLQGMYKKIIAHIKYDLATIDRYKTLEQQQRVSKNAEDTDKVMSLEDVLEETDKSRSLDDAIEESGNDYQTDSSIAPELSESADSEAHTDSEGGAGAESGNGASE
jgi:hypothetical protein